jgi:predicted negative regulator of RcsB-dependent stress response
MAHLNLHEQERINALKYFWRDYGKYVVGIFVVAAIAYVSNILWVLNSKRQSSHAAVIYAEFTNAVNAKDTKTALDLANKLEYNYPKVEYAAYASFLAAKIAYTNNNLELAINYLKWINANARDKGLIQLVKLRLADIYVDQKKFDAALAVLKSKSEPEFEQLITTKRGDVYVASGDIAHARIAYKDALQNSVGDPAIMQIVQLKLDVLGN